jgi:flagellar biosynthesis/type III secretory pathway protein FliH
MIKAGKVDADMMQRWQEVARKTAEEVDDQAVISYVDGL